MGVTPEQTATERARRARRWVIGSVAAFVAVVGAALWAALADPLAPRQHFPDGSVMTVEAVTWGRSHAFTNARAGGRLLAPAAPEGLRRAAGVRTIFHDTERPSAVFWIRRRLTRPGAYYLVEGAELRDAAGRLLTKVTPELKEMDPGETLVAWVAPLDAWRDDLRLNLTLRDPRRRSSYVARFGVGAPAGAAAR